MSVTLLVDNDVVVKLACMDAYSDGLASIGVAPAQVGSMGVMLDFMGLANEQNRRRLTSSAEEAARLHRAVRSITPIEPTDEEALEIAKASRVVLEQGLDFQAGELMLTVVATSRGGLDIATGDKRALRELPRLEAVWASVTRMRRRFVCLEQIFRSICSALGFPRVRAAVTTSPRADETITFVYEKTQGAGKSGFVAGLDLVIGEHIEKPAPGWLKP